MTTETTENTEIAERDTEDAEVFLTTENTENTEMAGKDAGLDHKLHLILFCGKKPSVTSVTSVFSVANKAPVVKKTSGKTKESSGVIPQ